MRVTITNQVVGFTVGDTVEVDREQGRQLVHDGRAVEAATADTAKPGTVDEIKAAVGDDPALAQAALDIELARANPRTTLVEHLQALVTTKTTEV